MIKENVKQKQKQTKGKYIALACLWSSGRLTAFYWIKKASSNGKIIQGGV